MYSGHLRIRELFLFSRFIIIHCYYYVNIIIGLNQHVHVLLELGFSLSIVVERERGRGRTCLEWLDSINVTRTASVVVSCHCKERQQVLNSDTTKDSNIARETVSVDKVPTSCV